MCHEPQKRLARGDLSCLAEFGRKLALPRPHARAPLGERGTGTDPFPHGSTVAVLSVLGWQGGCAPMPIAGAGNSAVFALDGTPRLVPCLRPGNSGWLDTGKVHYSPTARELSAATGARGLPLPAYSPDLKPIEACSSKSTESLRSCTARTKSKLYNALAKALALVTEADIRGWVEHCGYVFSLK